MKPKSSKQQKGPTPQGVQDLLRKAAKAEVEAKAAGLKAQRAKAQFKMCRKAFRKLKRLAKQALRLSNRAWAGVEPTPATSR
jgi:hypothetical protein